MNGGTNGEKVTLRARYPACISSQQTPPGTLAPVLDRALWTPKAGEGGHPLAGTVCNAIYLFHMAKER